MQIYHWPLIYRREINNESNQNSNFQRQVTETGDTVAATLQKRLQMTQKHRCPRRKEKTAPDKLSSIFINILVLLIHNTFLPAGQ